jgi:hypothetical protein
VDADQFAHSPSSRRSCVSCGFYCPHVSTNEDSYVAGAYIFFSQELDVGSFHHRICGFYSSDETFGFHHSKRF